MIQKAGLAALKDAGEDVARMKRIYNERRVFMIRRLREMGLGITVEPTGLSMSLPMPNTFPKTPISWHLISSKTHVSA
jgi:aspartate/methionine/tyrosine aminotransferase